THDGESVAVGQRSGPPCPVADQVRDDTAEAESDDRAESGIVEGLDDARHARCDHRLHVDLDVGTEHRLEFSVYEGGAVGHVQAYGTQVDAVGTVHHLDGHGGRLERADRVQHPFHP